MKLRKTNNKGLTIVELVVSIVLISTVLILITNLYLRTRNVYKNDGVEMEYELTKSIIIDAIEQDINNRLLSNVSGSSSITFTYQDGTTKNLSVSGSGDNAYVEYDYITRKLPSGTVISGISRSNIYGNLYEIKVNITAKNGKDYSINIYYRL